MHLGRGIYSIRTGNARVWQTDHAQWLLPVIWACSEETLWVTWPCAFGIWHHMVGNVKNCIPSHSILSLHTFLAYIHQFGCTDSGGCLYIFILFSGMLIGIDIIRRSSFHAWSGLEARKDTRCFSKLELQPDGNLVEKLGIIPVPLYLIRIFKK